MFGRAGTAHSDSRDNDGLRHRASGKSRHSPRDPSGTSVRRAVHSPSSWPDHPRKSDLVDQLFNSSEKRLARLLLLLANFGKEDKPEPMITKISQETLAEMIGTTRSRVSFFMNKFRKLGFIHYNGGIQVHSSLLDFVLHEEPHIET